MAKTKCHVCGGRGRSSYSSCTYCAARENQAIGAAPAVTEQVRGSAITATGQGRKTTIQSPLLQAAVVTAAPAAIILRKQSMK